MAGKKLQKSDWSRVLFIHESRIERDPKAQRNEKQQKAFSSLSMFAAVASRTALNGNRSLLLRSFATVGSQIPSVELHS